MLKLWFRPVVRELTQSVCVTYFTKEPTKRQSMITVINEEPLLMFERYYKTKLLVLMLQKNWDFC
jgi:hypothetical protein